MKIHFLSRKAMKMLLNETTLDGCIISISDTNKEKSEMREMKKILNSHVPSIFLNFLDIEDLTSGFTTNKADKLFAFIKKAHEEKQDVFIHCFLGVSRSGAVAKFINDYYGLQDKVLEEYPLYNKHIYLSLMEASGTQTLRSYYKNLEPMGL